jgi:hypothetical protein
MAQPVRNMEPGRDVSEISFDTMRRGNWQQKVSKAVASFCESLPAEDSTRWLATITLEEVLSIFGSENFSTYLALLRENLVIWGTVLETVDNCASETGRKPSSIVWSSLGYMAEVRVLY